MLLLLSVNDVVQKMSRRLKIQVQSKVRSKDSRIIQTSNPTGIIQKAKSKRQKKVKTGQKGQKCTEPIRGSGRDQGQKQVQGPVH